VICGAANAIYKAAKQGVSLNGSTLYTTDSPCPKCTHALISVGVKRVVYVRQYRMTEHLKLLTDSGISVEQISIKYEHLIK
jgi:dCMP deaminase